MLRVTSQVKGNIQGALTKLAIINSKISNWYKNDSKKITFLSRSEDLSVNEKVCIFHHSQHKQFRKRSSILKLNITQGTVKGHEVGAQAL